MKVQKDNQLSRTDQVEAGDLSLVVSINGGGSTPIPVTPTGDGSEDADNDFVPASVTSVLLLAANANRRSCFITNYSPAGATLYLRCTTAGSAAAIAPGEFTAILLPNGSFRTEVGEYSGPITGIWSGADAAGGAAVTEVVND